MTIYIDHRAGSCDLIRYPPLSTMYSAGDVELCELSSGDVSFSGHGPDGYIEIGIELKRLGELIGSSRNGRVQGVDGGQLVRMIDDYDIPYLLYYGLYRCSPDTDTLQVRRKILGKYRWVDYRPSENCKTINYSYLESMLASVQLANVNVKHVFDIKEAARWIAIMYKKFSKRWTDHRLFRTFNDGSDKQTETDNQRRKLLTIRPDLDKRTIACAKVIRDLVPGIGFERGVEIAKHFGGSVRRMINASYDEWLEIDGIGKVLAKSATESAD